VRQHDDYPDDYLRGILQRVRTIAVVGASDNPARPSYGVLQFLLAQGYGVVVVNPALRVGAIGDAKVYASLAEIPHPIDMVDVFRNNAAVDGLVDEVLRLDPLPSVIWMQLGVRVDAAAERAERRGIDVVMNRCPKIDYPKLIGRPLNA
jgi:uncharacterized protein